MKTYLRRKIRNVIDVRELIALEYLDFEGKYRDYTEDHDFWELCYAEKGQITVHLGDSRDGGICGTPFIKNVLQESKLPFSSCTGEWEFL